MTKEHCVLPSQWCLWKANVAGKGFRTAGYLTKRFMCGLFYTTYQYYVIIPMHFKIGLS